MTGNASLPATGSLHVPETVTFLGILKAREYFSGGHFEWNWDGRNHVTVSELSLECPPAAWADVSGKRVCRCEYQASARNMEFGGAEAEIKNGMAYISTSSASTGTGDVIRKTLCDGEVTTGNTDVSVDSLFGLYALGDEGRNLPATWSFKPHYGFGVPMAALRRGEALENLTIEIPDAVEYLPPGFASVRAQASLRPIWAEVGDTTPTWLPKAPALGVPVADTRAKYTIQMHPETVGGHDVLGAFKVTVEDRTKYPGFAMNASYGNSDDDKPDLRCDMNLSEEGGANQAWVCSDACELAPTDPDCGNLVYESLNRVDYKWQFYKQVDFAVSSYDFASYGKVKVDLVGIKTGPGSADKIMWLADNPARITGRPATETYTTLPIDRGEGQGTAGNKIADCGWEALAGNINDVFENPDEDIDPSTVELQVGDGLIAIEEYRGFKIWSSHRRTDPMMKDVFISSELSQGISYALEALPTNTHRVIGPLHASRELDELNRINFNSTGRPGHKDQCGLVIYDGGMSEEYWGYTFGAYGIEEPGVPCDITYIDVFTQKIALDTGSFAEQCTRYTIGHEVGHGVNMHHYLWVPNWWYSLMVIAATVPPVIMFANTPSTYGTYDLDDLLLYY